MDKIGKLYGAVNFINERLEEFESEVNDFVIATYGPIEIYSRLINDEFFAKVNIKNRMLAFKRSEGLITVFKIINDEKEVIDSIYPSVEDDVCMRSQGGIFR
ncbi:hypothetical protein P4T04_05230 [Bacillus badius]|uniref:hypothetical protein n=1 Tax=Bacillus badius TaxID=1455 RepID=UPI002E1AB456|nr:hypothetical protein [Bacillus badius]